MDHIQILEANLDLTLHSRAILDLLNAYAADPMGNGHPLEKEVLNALIPGLQNHPTTLIFIAFCENKAVGIVTCFKGFSTFMARQTIHISDFYVLPDYQGKKIGRQLLETVEKAAIDLQCCRVTLEVQENNDRALRIYKKAGFIRDLHVKEAGPALFFSKSLRSGE